MVVAGAAAHGVDAAVAVDQVVAGAAEHRVVAVAAADAVAAVPPSSVSDISWLMPLRPLSVSSPPAPVTRKRSTAVALNVGAPVANAAAGPPLGAMPIVSAFGVPL